MLGEHVEIDHALDGTDLIGRPGWGAAAPGRVGPDTEAATITDGTTGDRVCPGASGPQVAALRALRGHSVVTRATGASATR